MLTISKLLAEIDEYSRLPAGWDGESDVKTNQICLDMAKRFAKLLRPEHILPEVSAATGEEVALYWQDNQFYFIIHFFAHGSLRYFYKTSEKKESGVVQAFFDLMPMEIEKKIPY